MQHDVLVIGAGPAGSAVANQLARAGYDVRIADKKAFPRDKPCGEFLSPRCEPYLDELGLARPLASLGPRLVRGMRLHGYGIEAAGRFRRLADQPAWAERGLGVRRAVLDSLLLDAAVAAGAAWSERHEFVGLLRDADGRVTGANLRTPDGEVRPCHARFVVGADGVHSRVANALGVQRPTRWLDQFALVSHFDGVTPQPSAEVHLLPGGFFAATTVEDGSFSVNLVLPRQALRTRDANDWDEFVRQYAALSPPIAAKLAGATRRTPWRGTGPLAFTTTAQTAPGVALVGDACGYVDPLTGEGIWFALFGARELANAIHAAAADPVRERAAMRDYCRARRREIGPRLLASSLLQRAIRHPTIVRAFLRRAAAWPALADLMVTMSGDCIHPRDLLRPSFWRAFRAASA